jgi:hypothetical protein
VNGRRNETNLAGSRLGDVADVRFSDGSLNLVAASEIKTTKKKKKKTKKNYIHIKKHAQ